MLDWILYYIIMPISFLVLIFALTFCVVYGITEIGEKREATWVVKEIDGIEYILFYDGKTLKAVEQHGN